MRQIGSLTNEALAERFVDYLITRNISATCESDDEDWVIWVRDENQLDEARQALEQFEADPEAEAYRQVQRQAAELRAKKAKKFREAKKNLVEVSGSWNAPLAKRAPLVTAMIIASIALAVLGGFDRSMVHRLLMFADFANPAAASDGLINIRAGQIWRLLTPIFLHGGLVHLIFNMFMLYYLGTQVESKRGTLKFAGMVVATGVASNLLQYMVSGFAFLGMSGVVYGLFGYMWMRTTHDRASGYQLSQGTVLIMLIWFAIGFTGIRVGGASIANWAHAGGLGMGVILGLLPEWLLRRPA